MKVRGFELLTEPAAEHGDVGTLPAAVGVEFVEDEKLEPLGRLDEPFFADPCEDQLEHDVIRENDVGRVVADLVTLLPLFLARVPPHSYRRAILAERCSLEELRQLAQLAVGQSIHGIDDDRLDAPTGAVS